MRYVLYFFTLGLVFTAGMLVGNFYVPTRNATQAAALSVPDLDRINPALDQATPEQAQKNITALTQALASCPVVVEAERDRLFKQITLFLALQDFKLKKSVYETEIAKSAANARPTAKYSTAAAEYSAAKTRTEQLAEELFPPVQQQDPAADEAALAGDTETAASSATINAAQPNQNASSAAKTTASAPKAANQAASEQNKKA